MRGRFSRSGCASTGAWKKPPRTISTPSSAAAPCNTYTEDRAYLSSSAVEAGDVLLLASGGHGFTMLEQTEMIEVKQGPYAGDRDKVRFSPAEWPYRP